MSKVLEFPKRHARASSAAGRATGPSNPNKVGLTVLPVPSKADVKIMYFSAGMPARERQLLTAETPTPHSAATAAVPPRASMTSSTVESISPFSSRNVDSSRGHTKAIATTCEQWLNLPMISEREFRSGVARRLRQVRTAFFKNQTDLGTKMRVGKTAVSNYESGQRSVDPYAALQLKLSHEIPLEWLYLGVESGLSAPLAKALKEAAIQIAAEDAKKASKATRRKRTG